MLLHLKNNDIILGHVDFKLFFKVILLFEIFATLVALERSLPSVRCYVALQMTRRSMIVLALVTLAWLFSCEPLPHVHFQITSCNAGILTHCASVRLFPR